MGPKGNDPEKEEKTAETAEAKKSYEVILRQEIAQGLTERHRETASLHRRVY